MSGEPGGGMVDENGHPSPILTDGWGQKAVLRRLYLAWSVHDVPDSQSLCSCRVGQSAQPTSRGPCWCVLLSLTPPTKAASIEPSDPPPTTEGQEVKKSKKSAIRDFLTSPTTPM